MRVVKPLVIIEDDLDMVLGNGLTLAQHMSKKIELLTRRCYKSEGKMTDESYKTFIPTVHQHKGHEGIIEHRTVSVSFVTDRGVSHEAVRHRMAAYLQESTRYCDYASEGKAPHGVTYILPPWVPDDPRSSQFIDFTAELNYDDVRYRRWRSVHGWKPEEARYWLPQGVKTEYGASLNLSSWMNFLKKRMPGNAHPQIRQIAIPLARYFKEKLPEVFNGLKDVETRDNGVKQFKHRAEWYDEAKLVINPFYEQVELEEVPLHG